jgi:hypothetical protein
MHEPGGIIGSLRPGQLGFFSLLLHGRHAAGPAKVGRACQFHPDKGWTGGCCRRDARTMRAEELLRYEDEARAIRRLLGAGLLRVVIAPGRMRSGNATDLMAESDAHCPQAQELRQGPEDKLRFDG